MHVSTCMHVSMTRVKYTSAILLMVEHVEHVLVSRKTFFPADPWPRGRREGGTDAIGVPLLNQFTTGNIPACD